MLAAIPPASLVIGNAVAVGAPGTADHAEMQKGAARSSDPASPKIVGTIIGGVVWRL